MRPFPFYRAPAFVFHAADLYRDVALRWRGIGLGYLLALLALVWIPTALNARTVLRDFRERVAPPIIRQVPVVTVRDGKARVAGDGPQRIVDADGRVVALIDLEAGPSALEASGARVLVSEERIYLAQVGGEPRAFELSTLDDLIVTQPLLTSVTETLTRLATALAYPLGLAWSFTYRLGQALLFSVLGMILANTLQVRLPFAAIIRLSVMALTPVILLRTAQSLFGFAIPFWWFVGFAVFAVYLYFGLTAVRDAATPAEPEVDEGF
jgi:hypothetical protein